MHLRGSQVGGKALLRMRTEVKSLIFELFGAEKFYLSSQDYIRADFGVLFQTGIGNCQFRLHESVS